jgi:protein SCO1/2
MFSKRFIKFQIIFISAAVLLGAYYFLQARQHSALPMLGKVANFNLINSMAEPVTLDSLRGKVWVANFMFTTCSDICPMLTKNMSVLHKSFAGDNRIRLVSFSVNPENDTPAALKNYAAKYNADPKQWFFLTGSRESLTKLAVDSFKMGDVKEPIFHSSYFVLVDKQGNIRGYYDGVDTANLGRITQAVKNLL